MARNNPKAVVIFSGGLDSTTVLYHAINQGYAIHALTFDYGQKHKIEIDHAREIISLNRNIIHTIIQLNTKLFLSSALTGHGTIPKNRQNINEYNIPVTYVPARNLIFLSIAVGYAESHNINDIFIGVNSQDYSGYPDCRDDFISSFEKTANLATKSGREGSTINIKTPLSKLDKKDIIIFGKNLGVPYNLTWSCYDPIVDNRGIYHPCMDCDSCILRENGFNNAGITDTIHV